MIPARAIGRSLRLYHAPERRGVLDAFYGRFLGPGDLAFDVGCHVGDRAACFLRLGARVVAVEPQPRLARALRLLFRDAPGFALETVVLGAAPGQARLWVNAANPTVTTASADFVQAAQGAPGWDGQRWDGALDVAQTTLDALQERHGAARFIKIDVEGFEAEVLKGLSRPPAALSFEFTTIQRGVARACLERLAALGLGRFRASLGEAMRWAMPRPLDAAGMAAWIAALPAEANSGDIYAAAEDALLAD